MFKLRIKELAAKRGWTLKEVSELAGLPYSTVATYANSSGMVMVNLISLRKLAQVFEVSIEDLMEVLEDLNS
ncbi:helix-turn-helix domain-containing protein [Alkalinema pantanalense CENA528]|uniref:helix-turn-helix domain-containing protein n=1 Tax=Alkalinema pantanalense TaxID=1620705 RepID=UPI003D6F62AF